MSYSTEVTLYPRDFVGRERTVVVTGTSLTISASLEQSGGGDAGPWVVSDTITATGVYTVFMTVPLKFIPDGGTLFEVK